MNQRILDGLAVFGVLVAVVGVCGSAAASPVLTEAGSPVSVGTKVVATQTSPVLFTSAFITVTCKSSTLRGEVKENSGISIKVTMTNTSFTGLGGGNCETNGFGDRQFTFETPKIDWCLSSTGGNSFSVQAGACGGAASKLRFRTEPGLYPECVYQRPSTKPLIGSYGTGGGVLTFGAGEASEFTLESGSGLPCPESTVLDWAYALTVEGSATSITIS